MNDLHEQLDEDPELTDAEQMLALVIYSGEASVLDAATEIKTQRDAA
jgi:hypothetical protein